MQTEITLFDVSVALCLASFAATVLCLVATAFPALLQRAKQGAAKIGRTPSQSPRALFLRDRNRRDSRVRSQQRAVRPSLSSSSAR
jgi:hypothetical protein